MQHLRGESQGGAAAGKPVTGTARLQAPDHRAGRHAEGHQQDRERHAGYTEAMIALTPTEAAILANALRKPLRELQKQLDRLDDIHESGEATERQEARRCDIGETVTVLKYFFELESLNLKK